MQFRDKEYFFMSLMYVFSPCIHCCLKYDKILTSVEDRWEAKRYLKVVRNNPEVFLKDLR